MPDLTKEQQLIILGLVFLIITGLSVMAFRHFSPAEPSEIIIEESKLSSPIMDIAEIIVHVSGAVNGEGVYKLKTGDRIIDAIAMAGGATALADLSSTNLAEKVKDGAKVNIPVKVKVVEGGPGDSVTRKSEPSIGKVNINSASAGELCKISGIGPATAAKIIEYRSGNGPFSKIEDIMKVKTIGQGKFKKIKEQIGI